MWVMSLVKLVGFKVNVTRKRRASMLICLEGLLLVPTRIVLGPYQKGKKPFYPHFKFLTPPSSFYSTPYSTLLPLHSSSSLFPNPSPSNLFVPSLTSLLPNQPPSPPNHARPFYLFFYNSFKALFFILFSQINDFKESQFHCRYSYIKSWFRYIFFGFGGITILLCFIGDTIESQFHCAFWWNTMKLWFHCVFYFFYYF